MKFINYLFANKLSIRGWIRRCTLVLFGLSVIGLIVGYVFVNQRLTTDRVTSLLNKPEVITQIDKISNFLTGDQYIQISEASGFVTNKTGVWFEESDTILEVKLDGSCEDWFTTNNKKGALITNQSLCFRDTSKQQVVTWVQIMSGVTNNSGTQDAEISQFLIKYPSLGQMLSGGVVIINQQKLTGVESDINTMIQDVEIIDALVGGIHNVATIMLIPLGFMTIFFAIIMMIVLFIGLVIYSLIARAIAGIMKYDIDFEQAFSLSWLPWMIIKILGSIAGLDWAMRGVIWIIMIAGIVYRYKQQSTTTENTHE